MVVLQLATQHRIDRLGQGGALARTELTMVTKVAGHHGVGRVVEFQDQTDEFGAGLEQGFGMHGAICRRYDGRSRRAMARG